jgi:uncharacterized protein (DUF2147 family)
MSLFLVIAAAASTVNPFLGRWHTPGDKAVVEISPCGAQLCGTIIRAAPAPNTTTAPRDRNNPDPAQRGRPLAGLRMLSGFVQGRNGWTGGTIYNPTNGMTYRSNMTLGLDGNLKVSGCVAFICQEQVWLRGN